MTAAYLDERRYDLVPTYNRVELRLSEFVSSA